MSKMPLAEGNFRHACRAKEIRQAWWTGWKKLHGLKWQTVDFANGMNFHVYAPVSVVRHNDNYTLHRSEILAPIPWLRNYKRTNCSSLLCMAIRHTLLRTISCLAEVEGWLPEIEWGYKDLNTEWKYCLRLQGRPEVEKPASS